MKNDFDLSRETYHSTMSRTGVTARTLWTSELCLATLRTPAELFGKLPSVDPMIVMSWSGIAALPGSCSLS
ncbi:MAG: hypothetical protein E5X38_28245 [Mesorhizobium sp.]|uniref:hypothetical protein n=1 Tax=unclassified Mesorhizobium TaxID=325217 RepID=UPI000FE7452A|nr:MULTISPECIES: hypothetical protein [unclassified Mesorhizobium]MDF3170283.1 hypothetical protein [Mesorhizobium sp. P16.1]RWG29836.1 MAG: hypothetical protein EOQ59_25250 [Mesorhizobium sp.]RWG48860.1 MAG: hypothetical protein EOQ63_13140 [Mesorhizobium sp.]RWH59398.1 MAG: hypothetical protein EOQ83_25375 [Mesorhizobium sp.]RWI30612.1 MAG: hypothetical protein EOR13_30455 [Mesorhizobium sp.]